MKALLTGAGGFCGRHMANYLRGKGIEVFTLGAKDTGEPGHYHIADITDIEGITNTLRAVRPDYIFHIAGLNRSEDPCLFYRVNVQYAVALLHAIKKALTGSPPVLFVGTSAEYGLIPPECLPIREDAIPHPYSHYGISKLAQTLEGLEAYRSGYPIVIARPFNIIGEGMPDYISVQSFAMQIAGILKGDKPPLIDVGNLGSLRDFIDVTDVVEIYWRLIQIPSAYGKVVNVCTGRGVSVRDILTRLMGIAGIKAEVREDPARFRAIDIAAHYGSTDKLRHITGFVPSVDLDMSLWKIMDNLVNN